MNTQLLLDFVKTGMGSLEGASDELIRQFTNYLIVSTLLHLLTIGIIFGFLYASLGKGIKLIVDEQLGWKAVLRAFRVALVCSSVYYSYYSVSLVLKPIMAPHVWLIENGFKILKKG